MKTIFLVFLLVAAVYSEIEDDLNLNSEEKAHLKQIQRDCLAKTKARQDDVAKFDEGEFTDGPEIKHFFNCIFVNFGTMNEEGFIVKNKVTAIVPESQYKKSANCFDVHRDDPHQTAFDAYKCYIETVIVKNKNKI